MLSSSSTGGWSTLSKINSNTKLEYYDKKRITVSNPIFLDIADKVDDPYWKSIFIEFAKGKFIKGFVFNGKTLMCKNGTKYVDVDTNNPLELIDFLKRYTAKRSAMDLEREKDAEKELYNQNEAPKAWTSIRSGPYKRMLIIDFIARCKNLYKLTKNEAAKLETLICINLKDPAVNSNIEYNDGIITQIKNLRWVESSRTFQLVGLSEKYKHFKYNSCENINYVVKPLDIKDEKISTVKEWNKFIKKFNKSVGKSVADIPDVDEKSTLNNLKSYESSESYIDSSN
jgi:hypothetical protein